MSEKIIDQWEDELAGEAVLVIDDCQTFHVRTVQCGRAVQVLGKRIAELRGGAAPTFEDSFADDCGYDKDLE